MSTSLPAVVHRFEDAFSLSYANLASKSGRLESR